MATRFVDALLLYNCWTTSPELNLRSNSDAWSRLNRRALTLCSLLPMVSHSSFNFSTCPSYAYRSEESQRSNSPKYGCNRPITSVLLHLHVRMYIVTYYIRTLGNYCAAIPHLVASLSCFQYAEQYTGQGGRMPRELREVSLYR